MGTLLPHSLEKHLTSWLGEQKDKDATRWYLNFLKEAGPGQGAAAIGTIARP